MGNHKLILKKLEAAIDFEKQDKLDRIKKYLDTRIAAIEVTMRILNSTASRHKCSGDPVLRATLLVDKLCMVVDVGMSYLLTENKDFPDDLKLRMKSTSDDVYGELDFLLDWISSHQYSPTMHMVIL